MVIGRFNHSAKWYGFESAEEVADFFGVPKVEWVQRVLDGKNITVGRWEFRYDDGTTECEPHRTMSDKTKESFKVPMKYGSAKLGGFTVNREVEKKGLKKIVATGYYFDDCIIAVCPICHKPLVKNKIAHLTRCIGHLDYEVIPGGVIHVYEKIRSEDNL